MLTWCCSGRRNKVKNPDERSRLLDGDRDDDARNLRSTTTSPPTSSYNSPSMNNTPSTGSPNPELSYAYSYPNQEDAASLNNIVSKASEKMVNITNSTSSLKAATSMHSLRDLNSLSTWLESDPIKLDKATEFEQELIKQTANDLSKRRRGEAASA
ncbi:hypothetical protein WALSEDRAFT_70630 [Wallemia mellicola CBS 633.66]|uniref:Uncharacterized protein n=1 Tax=Wallemia mellicola (strain ATCC MYA-4683 / CBS 633.66) TaxID=671144 RepID=I4Y609_WALMC|nr:hypothetical protein WALSEDRAFT_70630 [Wallemia mellicola CBS 633.66]EIM19401.1 hypothetical protein WALSEDRAFT_70630 [Wallemia mellicola CBS 633.66]|eukprot:XP_006960551.1 hypothetical protein WALSEDRAFT_70630 [Wallemia mellicola CBS 633.66]